MDLTQPQEELSSQIGEENGVKDTLLELLLHNKLAVFSAVIILIIALAAIFAPVVAPYSFEEIDPMARLSPPSAQHLLGIGAQRPAASWGLMVTDGQQFLFNQPWLCLAPCVAIMIVVLAFNFLGDGLRDVLDPYMKNQ